MAVDVNRMSTIMKSRTLRLRSAAVALAIAASVLPASAATPVDRSQDTARVLLPAAAFTAESAVTLPRWYEPVTNLPSDWEEFGATVINPEHLSTIAGLAALTAGLMRFDVRNTPAMMQEHSESPALRRFADTYVNMGEGTYQLGFAGALAVGGLIDGSPRTVRAASGIAEAVAASGIVVQMLKHATGRESPAVASRRDGRWRFFPNQREYMRHQPRFYSFPSGHMATTTASLTVLCNTFDRDSWLRPVSYVALVTLGGTLVSRGMHWYSDLPLGAAIGYSFGEIVSLRQTTEMEHEESGTSVSVAPMALRDGGGLSLVVNF